ncbi:MAG: diguanylate cyclase [Micrococcales bacterium]|nr:diguanylate cyclase [Micrococcales bacterium]
MVSNTVAVLVALAAAVVLVLTARRLPRVLAVPSAVLATSVTAWTLAVALAPDPLLVHTAQVLGGWSAISVVVWLALRVSGWTHLATRRLLLVGWLPALLTVAVVFVPATRDYVVDESAGTGLGDAPVFLIMALVGVLVVAVALAVLLVVGSATTPGQRRLLVAVVASYVPSVVPWVAYISGRGEVTWTPTLLAATTSCWLVAAARRPGLAQLPITVQRVLAGIGEGVVVLTESGEVLSANAAAWDLLAGGLRSWQTYDQARLGPVPEPGMSTEVRTTGGRVVELIANRLDEPGRALTVVVTAREITEFARAREHLRDVASRDAMTGARNRRYLESHLPGLVGRARGRFPLSVVMLDVDRFKHVNDTYGHAMGDRVLVGVADETCASLPADAELVRMGGDEFAVMLPGMDARAARAVADRAAARCAELQFSTRPEPLTVTVSVGVCELRAQMSADDLLAGADEALYTAKRTHKATPVALVPHPASAPDDFGPIPVVPWTPQVPASPPAPTSRVDVPPGERRRDRRYRDRHPPPSR